MAGISRAGTWLAERRPHIAIVPSTLYSYTCLSSSYADSTMAQAGAALADRALQPRNSPATPSWRAMLRMLLSSGLALSADSCVRVFRTSKGVVMAPASPPATAPAAHSNGTQRRDRQMRSWLKRRQHLRVGAPHRELQPAQAGTHACTWINQAVH